MVGTQYRVFRGLELALAAAVFSIATKAAAQNTPPSPPAKQQGNGDGPEPPREQLGSQRQLVLSVERLLSISAYLPSTNTYSYMEGATTEDTSSSSGFSLLGQPTVAIDGFIWRHVSIGLTGTIGGTSGKSESTTTSDEGTTSSSQHGSSVSVVLAPRVGAAWTSESGLGVWARGAFETHIYSWSHASRWAGESSRQSDGSVAFSVHGDLLVTYSPAPHLALMAGPFVRTFLDGENNLNPISVGLNVNAGMFF